MSRVLLVSAGLDEIGGGTAVVGRGLVEVLDSLARRSRLELEVVHLGGSTSLATGRGCRAYDGDHFALARHVAARQLTESPRLVVFDHLGPARVQALLPRFWRSPWAVYVHGIEAWLPLAGTRRTALQGATRILVNSRYTATRAQEHNHWLRDFVVAPPALEPKQSKLEEAADGELLERAGKDFFLIVGRLAAAERYKGHDSLIETLARPEAAGARLVVAGEGDDRARLEHKAQGLGVRERVIFTGFVSPRTLRALYDRCLAFVLPSTDEGFGLVYLEAMRERKPCIGLARSAAAEIVVDGETGRLLPDQSPAALAAAIDELRSDPARARIWGENGHRRWQEHFQFATFASAIENALAPLLDTAKKAAV